LAALDKNVNV